MSASKKMKAWRDSRGLTQQQAANLAEVSQTAWSEYEWGHKSPKVEQAIRISKATEGSPHHVRVEDWAIPAADREERQREIRERRTKSTRARRRRAPMSKAG